MPFYQILVLLMEFIMLFVILVFFGFVFCFLEIIVFFIGGFGGNKIAHVEGGMDVLRDVEIIEDELRFKDQEYVSKQLGKAKKTKKAKEAVCFLMINRSN